MSEPPASPPDLRTAHRIIVTLVDALSASSDLVAVMARLMGETAVRPLQAEPAWQAYLEAKRRLEAVHDDMHRFAEAARVQIEAESRLADRPSPSDASTSTPVRGSTGDGA